MVIFGFINNVYAENEEEVCTSEEQNRLMKEASKVTASYEYVYNAINEVEGFNYLVYNIPSNMYVVYSGMKSQESNDSEGTDVLPIDRSTGTGKVFDDNITDIYTVKFNVYAGNSSCGNSLKTLTVKKVRYNKLSELEQCKYLGMEDYIYCQEWIDKNFLYSDEKLVEKINEEVENNKSKTSTICYTCDENERNDDIYNTIVKIRKYAILGLCIGILLDMITIMISFKRVGDSRI